VSTPASPSSKVLIIDDDDVIRITMHDYLAEAGFAIDEAEDGQSGLSAFERSPADIVLLDVMMPRLDGFAVCERLRATAAGAHVPILMITGGDELQSVSRAFHVGATDFVTKPINHELLVHRVQYILRAKRTADQLRERERNLVYAQRLARIGNWELDLTDSHFTCSEVLCDMFGLVGADITLESMLEAVHPDDRTIVEHNLKRATSSSGNHALEFRVVCSDRSEIFVHQDLELITDPSDEVVRVVGTIQDVTEKHEAETQIRELAYYDSVTSLPNRCLLNEHLRVSVEAAQRHDRTLAVLLIDLDHFKRINETWGHTVGDDLLRMVADRLLECLRQCDVVVRDDAPQSPENVLNNTIARLGGDEFVVLLTELRRAEDAANVAQRINKALMQAFTVLGNEVCISSSIGISVYPEDGESGENLLKHADAAMYEAKAEGRNGYHFHTRNAQSKAFSRLSLEASLRQALQRDEFILHYQPKVNIKSGSVVGMEALVRWVSPEIGIVSPYEFISVAEETGLIVPLGAWVLKTACAQTVAWHAAGLGSLCISVNLSAVQMRQSNLAREVAQALAKSGLDEKFLELELTESLLMDDVDSHIKQLHKLDKLGIKLSIDDFGTGYSSLSYLKRFPISTLKIDRSFITDIEKDPDAAAIVRGVVGLAHSLRLQVVAEGVEELEQLELLSNYGCDEAQGYYYTRPLPVEEFATWVRNKISSDTIGNPEDTSGLIDKGFAA
jgi:PAS domain S-box-containing protein